MASISQRLRFSKKVLIVSIILVLILAFTFLHLFFKTPKTNDFKVNVQVENLSKETINPGLKFFLRHDHESSIQPVLQLSYIRPSEKKSFSLTLKAPNERFHIIWQAGDNENKTFVQSFDNAPKEIDFSLSLDSHSGSGVLKGSSTVLKSGFLGRSTTEAFEDLTFELSEVKEVKSNVETIETEPELETERMENEASDIGFKADLNDEVQPLGELPDTSNAEVEFSDDFPTTETTTNEAP